MGSTKGNVLQAAEEVFGELPTKFVPGHPIAGSEQSGFEHSVNNLFNNRIVILTPTKKTDTKSTSVIKQMWQKIGAQVDEMSAEQHDAILSATSHLPHIVAYNLVSYLGTRADANSLFNYAAGGFYDFTRIASSDPTMWADICVANKDQIIESIKGFSKSLESLKSILEKSDDDAIYKYFMRAKKLRDQNLPSNKN